MLKQGHRLGDPFYCAHARSNDVFFYRPSDVPALVSRIEVYSEAAHVHELFSNMFKFLHTSKYSFNYKLQKAFSPIMSRLR